MVGGLIGILGDTMTTLQLPEQTAQRRPWASPLPRHIETLLESAGVRVNGPSATDVRIHDPELASKLRWRGLTGLAEAYVDAGWDCDDLYGFFLAVMRAGVIEKLPPDPLSIGTIARSKMLNEQSMPRARRDVSIGYDRGRRLMEATLDSRMVYTCGYWTWPQGQRAGDLAAAQEAKLDLICRKLDLREGMTLLDLGCGWGSLLKFAAERYGVRGHGVTLSHEQADYARESTAGLPVTIDLQDYRDLPAGQYDRIASIGMFEHVGPKNYVAFARLLRDRLKDDGTALLHFFVTDRPQPALTHREAMWVLRDIFPGVVVPSYSQVGAMLEADRSLVLEDLHNIGPDYGPTLLAWEENFRTNWHADAPLRQLYGDGADRFYRFWRYYLLICAAAFAARRYGLWQIVLRPTGVKPTYQSIR